MTPKAYLTTSWDDGHPLDQRLADRLHHYGLTGTFYIPKTAPSGVMTSEQIRELSGSFEIGAHTVNHVFLPEVDAKTARQEIAASRLWLQSVTGKSVPMFCPPAGKFAAQHLEMIRLAGFSAIRTVELMSLDAPRVQDGLVIMPTTLQAFPHASKTYLRNFARRFAARNLMNYLRYGGTREWARIADRLLQRVIRHGGVFHLWGHSWEIERTNQWAQLDTVLQMMSQVLREAPCFTNWGICQTLAAMPIGSPALAAK